MRGREGLSVRSAPESAQEEGTAEWEEGHRGRKLGGQGRGVSGTF